LPRSPGRFTNNLAQIEQVLDGFFRDAEKRADLNGLETPLRQVIGALTMMRHDDAVAVLQQCAKDIACLLESGLCPAGVTDFENVAEQLSLVGFFVDAMQHGATDFATFVSKMQAAVVQARWTTRRQASSRNWSSKSAIRTPCWWPSRSSPAMPGCARSSDKI
jgi:hypothetical protein